MKRPTLILCVRPTLPGPTQTFGSGSNGGAILLAFIMLTLGIGTVGTAADRVRISPQLVLLAQLPVAPQLMGPSTAWKFDVASIKLCKDDPASVAVGSGRGGAGGAGSYPREAIKGGPAWIHSDRYAIEAKADGPASQLVMKGPMMQALLEERFRLKVHRESSAVPAYALTWANINGTKATVNLQKSQPGTCFHLDIDRPSMPEPGKPPCGLPRRTNDGIDLRGATMEDLCFLLSTLVDRKVIDETGLKGTYDLHLDIPQELPLAASDLATSPVSQNHLSNDPTLAFAVLKRLGFKLGATNGFVEFIIVDHVEKPSEN